MDVLICCPHNEKQRPKSSSSSSRPKKLTVRVTLKNYKVIEYHDHINGRILFNYRPCPTHGPVTFASPRNPLCSVCKAQFIDYLVRHLWSMPQAEEKFECFYQEVMNEVSAVINNDKDGRRRNFEHVYEIRNTVLEGFVDDEETFWGLVDDSNGHVVYEERVAVQESGLYQPGVGLEVVRTVPASESAIKGLEKVRKKGEVNELLMKGDNTCGICLQDLLVLVNKKRKLNDASSRFGGIEVGTRMKKSIVKLPCKHVFHEGCITKWLHSNHVCPFCRFELPVDDKCT